MVVMAKAESAVRRRRRSTGPVGEVMIYKRKWPAAVFLIPAFLFMVIFLYYPFFRNIVDSFFNIRILGGPTGKFIGFEN